MDLNNYKDFYIDLDGDIKASVNTNETTAKFITTNTKPNSDYVIAKTIDELLTQIKKFDPNFNNKELELFKQYAIKTDSNGTPIGIKIYANYNPSIITTFNYIILGYDINHNGILGIDFYFTAPINDVKIFIKQTPLNYDIKEFETHKPILYSIKRNLDGELINFKTYYFSNDQVNLFTNNIIMELKKNLMF